MDFHVRTAGIELINAVQIEIAIEIAIASAPTAHDLP
jgi:hypothetical protein